MKKKQLPGNVNISGMLFICLLVASNNLTLAMQPSKNFSTMPFGNVSTQHQATIEADNDYVNTLSTEFSNLNINNNIHLQESHNYQKQENISTIISNSDQEDDNVSMCVFCPDTSLPQYLVNILCTPGLLKELLKFSGHDIKIDGIKNIFSQHCLYNPKRKEKIHIYVSCDDEYQECMNNALHTIQNHFSSENIHKQAHTIGIDLNIEHFNYLPFSQENYKTQHEIACLDTPPMHFDKKVKKIIHTLFSSNIFSVLQSNILSARKKHINQIKQTSECIIVQNKSNNRLQKIEIDVVFLKNFDDNQSTCENNAIYYKNNIYNFMEKKARELKVNENIIIRKKNIKNRKSNFFDKTRTNQNINSLHKFFFKIIHPSLLFFREKQQICNCIVLWLVCVVIPIDIFITLHSLRQKQRIPLLGSLKKSLLKLFFYSLSLYFTKVINQPDKAFIKMLHKVEKFCAKEVL